MYMPALTGEGLLPFGHKAGLQAHALRHNLGEGLEKDVAIGSRQGIGHLYGSFQRTGAGFLVQGLQRQVETRAELQKSMVELSIYRCPQN